MSLTEVRIGEEVWLTCLSHALTTETEEVMGLLFGDIKHSSRGGVTAVIWGASPQMRCDRKKDRVEVNPELLAAATAQAESLSATIGEKTRVIGWYHSHPHITVLPSHVDVRTQAMFQLMEPGFVGLIFSCFSEDAQKVGKIQVIAFQSLGGNHQSIVPVNDPVINLESSWSSLDTSSHPALIEGIEQDTGDSKTSRNSKVWEKSSDVDFYSHSGTNHSAKHQSRENAIVACDPNNAPETPVDLDESDMTPSIQEALHRSNMDISGAEYVRKEVPLYVFPTGHLLKLDTTLTSYCDMQHVIFEEEKSAYNQAMHQNIRDGKIHPLTSIHHASTYNSSLCKLMEYCLSPAITVLQDRLKENEIRLSMLMEEAKQLEAENQSMRNDSPRRLMYHGTSGSSSLMAQDKHAAANQMSPRSPSGSSRRKAS
ncbi:lys-63-specific deubiquitinase BRCC36-like [Oryza brachyantha]|uniref:MPN domain-containing protein n=1 Tax=Oryza brachyantha TaxID=4533 RepID=J3M9C1_ORYBR|nr:lys-63-specific deubiquitinase BRCC36-like [Oryza brachyantha]